MIHFLALLALIFAIQGAINHYPTRKEDETFVVYAMISVFMLGYFILNFIVLSI